MYYITIEFSKTSIVHVCLSSTTAKKFYFDPSYKQLSMLGEIVASKYGEFVVVCHQQKCMKTYIPF